MGDSFVIVLSMTWNRHQFNLNDWFNPPIATNQTPWIKLVKKTEKENMLREPIISFVLGPSET